MSFTTYSDLQTSVASWLARSDLASQIPDFIRLFEAKADRTLSVRQMEVRATTSVDTTQVSPEFVSLPTDFQSMRWIRLSGVQGRPRLEYKSPLALDEIRTQSGDIARQPRYFTILAADIELCPTPDSDYTIEMVYRQAIPPLSDGNTSNWLLQNAPDVYLYGALSEASAFIQNDERVPMWDAKYKLAISELETINRSAAFGAAPVSIWVSGSTP